MSVPAVVAHNFGVRFGDFQALEGINLEVAQGAFVAIVGPNGAGKSTLLKALLGIAAGSLKDGVTQTVGQLNVLGQTPQTLAPGRVGYVPQVKSFDRSFPALAIEVVVSGLRRAWPFWITRQEQAKAEAMLEKVGALKLSKRRLGRLSGGELQRVYLARALIREPQLLLLDEPATGVDAVGEADLYRHLDAYQNLARAASPTILMITHDWEAAEHHASQVLLMNRRVIAYAPPKSALSHDNLALAFGHMGHKHGPRMG